MTEATMCAINDLNEELIAAAARLLACGLSPASKAKSLRGQRGGEVVVTDGPYLIAKERVGGFWILNVALVWGRKTAGGLAGVGAVGS